MPQLTHEDRLVPIGCLMALCLSEYNLEAVSCCLLVLGFVRYKSSFAS